MDRNNEKKDEMTIYCLAEEYKFGTKGGLLFLLMIKDVSLHLDHDFILRAYGDAWSKRAQREPSSSA